MWDPGRGCEVRWRQVTREVTLDERLVCGNIHWTKAFWGSWGLRSLGKAHLQTVLTVAAENRPHRKSLLGLPPAH